MTVSGLGMEVARMGGWVVEALGVGVVVHSHHTGVTAKVRRSSEGGGEGGDALVLCVTVKASLG